MSEGDLQDGKMQAMTFQERARLAIEATMSPGTASAEQQLELSTTSNEAIERLETTLRRASPEHAPAIVCVQSKTSLSEEEEEEEEDFPRRPSRHRLLQEMISGQSLKVWERGRPRTAKLASCMRSGQK